MRLDRDHAQRVIARALELQDLRDGRIDGLDIADVMDVARQLGIDPSLVRRAALDVRLAAVAEHEPSRTERVLGPTRMAAASALDADLAAVQVAVARWMVDDEGMRAAGARGSRERWVKDKRILTEVRRGLQPGRASGVLRGLDQVVVTVEPVQDRTMLALEADTGPIRRTTIGISAAATATGAVAGTVAAAVLGDTGPLSGDLAQFAVTAGAWAGGGLAIAQAVRRSWTEKARRAIAEAIDGITMTASSDQAVPRQTAGGWRAVAHRLLGGGADG